MKVFSNTVHMGYRRRLWLYLVGWPFLLLSGLRLANQCVASLRPNTIVIAQDHILLLAFQLRAFFSLKAKLTKPKVTLHGFIYTPRSNSFLVRVCEMYFKMLFWKVSLIICYANHEVGKIKKLINPSTTNVCAVRYGIGEGRAIGKWWSDFQVEKARLKQVTL